VYYAYAFFPVLFWEEVFAQRQSLVKGGKILFRNIKSGADIVNLVFATLGFFGLLQALVCIRRCYLGYRLTTNRYKATLSEKSTLYATCSLPAGP
jgi:phosphatidylinositol glycan class N